MSENYSLPVQAVLDEAATRINFCLSEVPRLSTRNPMKETNLKEAADLRSGVAKIKAALEKVAKLKHVLELLDKDAVYKTEEAEQRGDEEVEQFHSGRSHAAREALYWLNKEPEP
jgi:DNA-binding ferritin-like protein